MRDHSHHIELSREEAVSRMLKAWNFPDCEHGLSTEIVDIWDSFGRTLAVDVYSKVDVPNALQCMMDSIAVHWSDFEDGQMPDTSKWIRGVDWEFANTGIAMPEGFDTAIVIEHVKVSDDEQHVSIDAAPSRQFAGTKPAGSNLQIGDLLAEAGQIITADIAAKIASGNVSSVQVCKKPRVAFIPTGTELVSPGGKIAKGMNIETNSLLARAKILAWGGIPMIFDIVPDDPVLIEEAVLLACKTADIVVLNAGSSKGSDDWCCEKLEEIGELICHETNHGPGHHSSYALVNGKPIVGISGPPAGASFTLNFYLRPLMMRFLGRPVEPEKIPVKLKSAFAAGGHGPQGKAGAGAASAGAASAGTDAASAKSSPSKVAGEERPSVVKPGAEFFAIKFLDVQADADGSLVGIPRNGRPGSPETESANAYYMMPTGSACTPPAAGDVIWVELR